MAGHPVALGLSALMLVAAGVAAGVWASGRQQQADAEASLSQTASAAGLADRATRLSAAYAGLVQQTGPAMQALERHFFGERRVVSTYIARS